MKGNTLLVIIIAVLATLIFAPSLINLKKDKEETPEYVTVIESDFEWEQEASTLNLLQGNIKASAEVEKIYVNVAGVGVLDLEYTASIVSTETRTYVAHAITPMENLFDITFEKDIELTADIYIEYNGKALKVDTQTVQLKAATETVVAYNEDELPRLPFIQ